MRNITNLVLLFAISQISYADNNNYYWEQLPIITANDIALGRDGGEGFQMVESIVYAPSDPSIMYLSTNTSQVWKSVNGGKNWQLARNGILSHGVASLAVSPDNSNIVFAAATYGAEKPRFDKYPDRIEGIYRTIDGGATWEMRKLTHFNISTNKGRLLAFVRNKNGSDKYTVYAGTYKDGLLASTDQGLSWEVIESKFQNISDLAPDPTEPGILYVASDKGLYRYEKEVFFHIGKGLPASPLSIAISDDKTGRIWVTVEGFGVYVSYNKGQTFVMSNATGATVVGISPVNSDLLLAKRDQSIRRKPLVSSDGGLTWKISGNVEILDVSYDKKGERFWFSAPFAFHPNKANVVFTASNGRGRILKSIDSGNTWSFSGSGFTGARMTDMAFLANGGIIFCYTDHGLWLSKQNDKGPYKFLNVPRVNKLRSCSAVASKGNTIVAAIGSWDKQALVVSKDLGMTWKIYDETKAYHRNISFDPIDSNYIFAGNYVSHDNGNSWDKIAYNIRAVDIRGWLYSLTTPNKNTSNLLISKDKGVTWSILVDSIPIMEDKIHDVSVSISNQIKAYLGTSFGVVVIKNNTWELMNENNQLDKDKFGMTYVNSVGTDSVNANIVYVGRRSPGLGQSIGVFISSNSGTNWSNITANLAPYLSVWSIKVDPGTDNVYIGTSLGTYRLIKP